MPQRRQRGETVRKACVRRERWLGNVANPWSAVLPNPMVFRDRFRARWAPALQT